MKALKSRPIVIGLLISWLLLTVFAIHLLIAEQLAHRKSEFLHNAQAIISDIRIRLNSNEVVLAGFSAFLQSVDQDDTSLATKFASTVTRSYSHIYMIEVARKVLTSEREEFESAFRKAWRADFSIKNFAEVKKSNTSTLMNPREVWPIVFMYPSGPEVAAIYGVDLNTVDYLSTALQSAHASSRPIASSVFNLYEGGRAYILLQEVSNPSSLKTSANNPSLFGSTMMAMLLIKTDALLPNQPKSGQTSNFNYRATMLSSDGKINSILFERKGQIGWSFNRIFLPDFQLTEQVGNESQPVVMDFSQSLRWTDLLGWGNLVILALFALTLVVVPRLTILHLRTLTAGAREQERVTYLATHDTLTALPNRMMLADRFHQIYQNWKRNQTPFALALIDLDGFKSVNDQYGHDVGDEVLKAFSLRLTSVLRAVDTITRHGGDEFVVLLANVSNADEGKLMGQKIIAATAEPIETAAGPMSVSCSIGISICPVHGQSLDTLRHAADQAMYHSKHQGGNAVCVFSPMDS